MNFSIDSISMKNDIGIFREIAFVSIAIFIILILLILFAFFFFLMVLGFVLRGLCLLGKALYHLRLSARIFCQLLSPGGLFIF
jgi:hypothetical protein